MDREAPAKDPMAKLRELDALGNPGFVANLCRLFLGELDKRLPRMGEALGQEDAPSIREDAHLLKSASAALGAKDMSELCSRIEKAARGGHLEEIGGLLEALSAERVMVERDLLQELKEGS
jgi:HPt (histidine-containing phosphotransfer) domain-containing protein